MNDVLKDVGCGVFAQVAVVNLGLNATDSATVTWEMIQFDKPAWKTAEVRDLWLHKDLGTFDGSYSIKTLESHATALLIVKEKV